MESLIKEVKEKNKKYPREQIEFTSYCLNKMDERSISRENVLSVLTSDEKPIYAKIQRVPYKEETEKRYKLIYKISGKYSLIIIIAYYENILKVINVIKTSKDMEKKWKKQISK